MKETAVMAERLVSVQARRQLRYGYAEMLQRPRRTQCETLLAANLVMALMLAISVFFVWAMHVAFDNDLQRAAGDALRIAAYVERRDASPLFSLGFCPYKVATASTQMCELMRDRDASRRPSRERRPLFLVSVLDRRLVASSTFSTEELTRCITLVEQLNCTDEFHEVAVMDYMSAFKTCGLRSFNYESLSENTVPLDFDVNDHLERVVHANEIAVQCPACDVRGFIKIFNKSDNMCFAHSSPLRYGWPMAFAHCAVLPAHLESAKNNADDEEGESSQFCEQPTYLLARMRENAMPIDVALLD